MHTQQLLFKLRTQWFKLNAKDFLKRYQNGLIALVFLLPGVALGDNFYLLFKVLSAPFLLISNPQTPFIVKFMWLLVLQSVFIVFCRAQKTAITGGKITVYLQSFPISEITKTTLNFKLLLLANHFLWVVILASFYFHLQTKGSVNYFNFFSNVLLVLLLLTAQYVSIFKLNLKLIFVLIGINVLFILAIPEKFALPWLMIVFIAWLVFTLQLIKPDGITIKTNSLPNRFVYGLKSNFYYQILFKATTTSTLFRLLIIVLLMIGFALISSNLSDSNKNQLFPYSLTFEAFLAYYFSGFFVTFDDQRQSMKDVLSTLPVSKTFWFWRDFLTVIFLSSIFHLILYVITLHIYNVKELISLLSYYVALLLVSYPVRIFVKKYQTNLTLVVLIIITAITLFNIS